VQVLKVYIHSSSGDCEKEITREIVTIGSSPDADVQIAGVGLAGSHLRLFVERGKIWIAPVERNHVNFGGRPLPFNKKTKYSSGEVVRLGHSNTTVVFSLTYKEKTIEPMRWAIVDVGERVDVDAEAVRVAQARKDLEDINRAKEHIYNEFIAHKNKAANELHDLETKKNVLHDEFDALLKLRKNVQNSMEGLHNDLTRITHERNGQRLALRKSKLASIKELKELRDVARGSTTRLGEIKASILELEDKKLALEKEIEVLAKEREILPAEVIDETGLDGKNAIMAEAGTVADIIHFRDLEKEIFRAIVEKRDEKIPPREKNVLPLVPRISWPVSEGLAVGILFAFVVLFQTIAFVKNVPEQNLADQQAKVSRSVAGETIFHESYVDYMLLTKNFGEMYFDAEIQEVYIRELDKFLHKEFGSGKNVVAALVPLETKLIARLGELKATITAGSAIETMNTMRTVEQNYWQQVKLLLGDDDKVARFQNFRRDFYAARMHLSGNGYLFPIDDKK
jgi:co-chaperonin GroES (HSP10)